MRPQKNLILLATAAVVLAAAGCSHNTPDNATTTDNANVNPAAQKQTSGGTGGATMAHPMAAPPGYKTGDLSGGRK